jgi:hypothetical protein
MSEAPKYDHPLRLLKIGGMIRGSGATVEECRAAVAEAKRSLVPVVAMSPPDGTTAAEADRAIVIELEEIFRCCARIRGIVEAMPAETYPTEFREDLLTVLYEILLAADVPWQALTPAEPARMSMPGYFARLARRGQTVTSVRIEPGPRHR